MKRISNLDSRSGIYEITPAIAEGLLEQPGGRNRPLKKATVIRYAARMSRGQWRVSGEPILVGVKGNLLDGQHRLCACVEAGKPFTTTVLYGDFQFLEMGQGRMRSGADAIALGIPEAVNMIALSAIAGFCMRHQRAMEREWSMYTQDALFDIDNKERVGWVRKNLRVLDLYRRTIQLSGPRPIISPSPATAAWYLAEMATSVDEAGAFFEGLLSGASLKMTDIRLLLRRSLGARTESGKRLVGIETLHWIAKAWDLRNDTTVRRTFSVKRTESFPFIR